MTDKSLINSVLEIFYLYPSYWDLIFAFHLIMGKILKGRLPCHLVSRSLLHLPWKMVTYVRGGGGYLLPGQRCWAAWWALSFWHDSASQQLLLCALTLHLWAHTQNVCSLSTWPPLRYLKIAMSGFSLLFSLRRLQEVHRSRQLGRYGKSEGVGMEPFCFLSSQVPQPRWLFPLPNPSQLKCDLCKALLKLFLLGQILGPQGAPISGKHPDPADPSPLFP